MGLHKDEALDRLALNGNVAQFIAFRPDNDLRAVQTTSRVRGFAPNHIFKNAALAIKALLAASPAKQINIRSYLPDDPQSKEFIYAIDDGATALAHFERLSAEGLHLIVNETVDIEDGGVSGVAQGNVIEFSPDDTPRAVEKPGVASLEHTLAMRVLRTVYGFMPDLPDTSSSRVEFSIHPKPCGWLGAHTLLWEIEDDVTSPSLPALTWPNRFSEHLGDKAFGLLIADTLGLRVPFTNVIGRRVAPFSFGKETGSSQRWLRTAPRRPEPGLFTTTSKWIDPFTLLANEDPERMIASVIVQAAVPAVWSGAAIIGVDGSLIIEGVAGGGDKLMLGEAKPAQLPGEIISDVSRTHNELKTLLGDTRIEWVHDGTNVWIVQMHVGATATRPGVIVDGEAEEWATFDATAGLPALRTLLATLNPKHGILINGSIGLTSHLADILRKSGYPSRIASKI